jgi:hypothetical protein
MPTYGVNFYLFRISGPLVPGPQVAQNIQVALYTTTGGWNFLVASDVVHFPVDSAPGYYSFTFAGVDIPCGIGNPLRVAIMADPVPIGAQQGVYVRTRGPTADGIWCDFTTVWPTFPNPWTSEDRDWFLRGLTVYLTVDGVGIPAGRETFDFDSPWELTNFTLITPCGYYPLPPPPLSTITVLMTDCGNKPVEEAAVSMGMSPFHDNRLQLTGADGITVFTDVTPGDYSVFAQGEVYQHVVVPPDAYLGYHVPGLNCSKGPIQPLPPGTPVLRTERFGHQLKNANNLGQA